MCEAFVGVPRLHGVVTFQTRDVLTDTSGGVRTVHGTPTEGFESASAGAIRDDEDANRRSGIREFTVGCRWSVPAIAQVVAYASESTACVIVGVPDDAYRPKSRASLGGGSYCVQVHREPVDSPGTDYLNLRISVKVPVNQRREQIFLVPAFDQQQDVRQNLPAQAVPWLPHSGALIGLPGRDRVLPRSFRR